MLKNFVPTHRHLGSKKVCEGKEICSYIEICYISLSDQAGLDAK